MQARPSPLRPRTRIPSYGRSERSSGSRPRRAPPSENARLRDAGRSSRDTELGEEVADAPRSKTHLRTFMTQCVRWARAFMHTRSFMLDTLYEF